MASMSERYEALNSLLGGYGYQFRYAAGSEDGSDWEVAFQSPAQVDNRTYIVAAPNEQALLGFLGRWLPERAVNDWRSYALMLEGQVREAKR